jgi:predicted DNA binding protein
MTLSATIHVDSSALATSVGRAPDVDVTIEQRTMTEDGSLDLTLRGSGAELNAFEAGLEEDETVSRWTPVGGTDTRRLYRVRLTERASSTIRCDRWADGMAVFPSIERTEGGWTVEAVLPTRAVLQQFRTNCESDGVGFELLRVTEGDQSGDDQQFGLTELQAETLLTAFDRGYYSVPRRANLEDLAEPLGVSHQALSERLRRGIGSLIEHTVKARWVDDGTDDGPDRVPAASADPSSRDGTIERPVAFNL